MKKVPEDQDMPDEIDFTGGVRGKYASRYREGVSIRERSATDPAAMSETHSSLGVALRQAQAFEAVIVAYLTLVEELALKEAGRRAHDFLEHSPQTEKPAHTWGFLRKDKDLEKRFAHLARERNWIVHHCNFDIEALVNAPERQRELVARLEQFADEARSLTQYLISHIELNLSRRGLSISEIEAETRQVIEKWAAA